MSPEASKEIIADLPAEIAVFPLTGVLLLPGGRLPLNIFEPRYLAMIDHAFRHGRLIGMVQPRVANPADNHGDDLTLDDDEEIARIAAAAAAAETGRDEPPALYDTGCVGKIVQFEETDDGRYIVVLEGLSRFRIEKELPLDPGGFRKVAVNWQEFGTDLAETGQEIDRDRLIPSLQQFFEIHGLSADWEAIAETPDDRLVTTLCMICPFEPGEKQALLEAPDLASRVDVMQALIDMAVHEGDDVAAVRH
ncbi:MAG: LON peptidase substrate-binding domain-containing protein [Alphaproteobacteria bacterium]|nr:LON peptidase substrate-binding domain-containing protein [Alphaproteobacteria bacterium SS10]